ncbi:MAG: hypothetical protein V2I57_04200 [Xanthomonadales bacterium]|jgi:hypothetical protein|nr:hypothetical protein [Xanthomonadales bacterium]
MSDIAQSFEAQRYAVLRHLVPPHALRLMFEATLLNRAHEGYMIWDKRTQAWGRYCDAMGEALLIMLHAPLQRRLGLELLPCYSYLRCYTPESRLPSHLDRPSCEISVTLPVGQYRSVDSWPIWVESAGQNIPVDLKPGDLLAYRGAEVPHWREPLEKGLWIQVFLHYVDANGDYTAYALDQRERLGPVSLPVKDRPGINLPARGEGPASN